MSALIPGYLTAFVITYLAIPAIIFVAIKRRLFDLPNDRSSHEEPTPSLGGIAIFAGVICSIVLWTPPTFFTQLQHTLAAAILLFLIGVRDDLVPVPPKKKLIVQVLAAAILSFKAEVLINNWWGLFGVYELPYFLSVLFSIVAIVGIINAFNLIDGINGLAGGVGLIASVFFGYWFYCTSEIEWAMVGVALAGAITAFLRYNITPARIFMGDTGSLIVGLLCAVLAIEFLQTNEEIGPEHAYYFVGAPVITLSVLILPLFDTIKVFFVRVKHGKSPFHADRTHLHHRLIDCNISHTNATLILLTANLIIIISVILLQHIGLNRLLLALFIITLVINFMLDSYWKKNRVR